jgi:hypothetical protein
MPEYNFLWGFIMKLSLRRITVFLVFAVGFFWATAVAAATAPVIAKVSDFKGTALLMSGTKIRPITGVGLAVRAGDRIQTKQGSVEVAFNDGAIINVYPFTSTMIQEKEEAAGLGFWKKKVSVRRVTCFVGKLWFKSGLAKAKKNYLQTPTAVCGIRGSDGDIGFDGIQTYLNMYHGEADNVGDVLIGFFENPGAYVAENSDVYNTLERASREYERSVASGDPEEIKRAVASALAAAAAAGESLANNPDPEVAENGRQIQEEALEILEEMGFAEPADEKEPASELAPEDDPEFEDDDPCEGADPCDLNCDGEVSNEESTMCGEYISQ